MDKKQEDTADHADQLVGENDANPTDLKKYVAALNLIERLLRVDRRLGISLYEARVNALREATRVTGIDFTQRIALIPEDEPDKEDPAEGKRDLAEAFFEALNGLRMMDLVRAAEVKHGRVMLRISVALRALDGYRFVYTDIMAALRKHPAFIASRVPYRGYFGDLTSSPVKAWAFDAAILTGLATKLSGSDEAEQ